MQETILYGLVYNNRFISNLTNIPIKAPNGFYCVDIASSNPTVQQKLEPADIGKLKEFVKKSKYMQLVNGYSFGKSMITQNYIEWTKKGIPLPVELKGSLAEDWEFVKAVYFPKQKMFYYLESVYIGLYAILFEVKEAFENRIPLDTIKGITPEMRILYTFHCIQRLKNEEEIKRLEMVNKLKTVEGRLKYVIEQSGGRLLQYKEINGIGYEVIWQAFGEKINTVINYDFAVLEAGYCVSGYDKLQSMSSVVKLLHDYKDQNDHIVITRR